MNPYIFNGVAIIDPMLQLRKQDQEAIFSCLGLSFPYLFPKVGTLEHWGDYLRKKSGVGDRGE